MDTINDDEVRFTMRMETALYERLKESAKKNKRSIAKELEYIVDYYFNDRAEFLADYKRFIDLYTKQQELWQSKMETLAELKNMLEKS